jgi:hypothetical protein
MANDFSMFMKENVEDLGVVEVEVSKRFKDKDGNPVKWQIKAIDSERDSLIKKECTKKVAVNGKKGQYIPETDTDKYLARVCVACIIYPDLNNAELQDSYGVKSGDALLNKMLLAGEFAELKATIMEINGFDMSMDELVDEAKN